MGRLFAGDAGDAGNGCLRVTIPIGGHVVMDPKEAAFATPEFSKPRARFQHGS